jgi:hypothetical protein
VVKRETMQRVASPTAILVGVAEPLATHCTAAIVEGGLRVLRVGHVAAANERIPIVMPQLVVVSTIVEKADLETLSDRCVAVGAEIFNVAPDADSNAAGLKKALKEAATTALIRSLRRGG